MKKLVILITLMLSVLTISCGEDENYEGVYETTRYEEQKNSCSGEFKPISFDDYKFFNLEEKSIFGTTFYQMYACKSNDKSSCETSFGKTLDDYDESFGKGNEKECIVGKVSFSIKSTSDGVKITETHKSVKFNNIELKDCDSHLLEGHENELKCEKVIVREGKRL